MCLGRTTMRPLYITSICPLLFLKKLFNSIGSCCWTMLHAMRLPIYHPWSSFLGFIIEGKLLLNHFLKNKKQTLKSNVVYSFPKDYCHSLTPSLRQVGVTIKAFIFTRWQTDVEWFQRWVTNGQKRVRSVAIKEISPRIDVIWVLVSWHWGCYFPSLPRP